MTQLDDVAEMCPAIVSCALIISFDDSIRAPETGESAQVFPTISRAILNAVQKTEAAPENSGAAAFIFDMDGVLVHSMPWHTLAWERYLQGLGMEVENLERRMHGKRNVELIWDLLGEHVSEKEALAHGAAKERVFRDLLSQQDLSNFLIPGILEFLERYRRMPKALGSNAERENIDFALDHFGLRRYFPVAIDGSEVQCPKPFPDIYLKAAAGLAVKPERCIVFEDSPPGAQAGIDAGMRVVGIESTSTEFSGVALKITDFNDPKLEPWLQLQMNDG